MRFPQKRVQSPSQPCWGPRGGLGTSIWTWDLVVLSARHPGASVSMPLPGIHHQVFKSQAERWVSAQPGLPAVWPWASRSTLWSSWLPYLQGRCNECALRGYCANKTGWFAQSPLHTQVCNGWQGWLGWLGSQRPAISAWCQAPGHVPDCGSLCRAPRSPPSEETP